jgi:hypothetical protein
VSSTIQIAEAVAGELNCRQFGQGEVRAVRAYRPPRELEQLSGLQIFVIPDAVRELAGSRGANRIEHEIHVVIARRVANDAEVDDLIAMMATVRRMLRSLRLAGAADAAWGGSEIDPLFDADHLNTLEQFTSVLKLMYQTME